MSGSPPEPAASDLLTKREVAKMVRLSPSTITRYVREGRFPAPIRFSYTCVRWRRQHIEEYLARLPVTRLGSRSDRARWRLTAAERQAALQSA